LNISEDFKKHLEHDKHLKRKQIKDLKILFNDDIDSDLLYDVISEWNKYAQPYLKNLYTDPDLEIRNQEKFIACIQIDIKRFDKLKANKNRTAYSSVGQSDKVESDIQAMQKHVSDSQERIALLKYIKTKMCSPKKKKLNAIIRVFSIGEHLGLKYEGKPGRSIKDPLLDFAKIVTGIKGRNTILKYYKKYKELINPAIINNDHIP
jgi:hypothetical protein